MKFESESGEYPEPGGIIGEKKFNPLFESLSSDPGSLPENPPAETPNPTFKPTSVDVENFVSSKLIFSDWKREDFLEAAQKAKAHGEERNGQTAEYLADHVADVSALSQSGMFGISRSDLNLYGKLLKANESSTDPAGESIDGLKKVHDEHEFSQSILPHVGSAVALYGGFQGLKALAHVPEVANYAMAFKAANPRAYLPALWATAGATWVASYYGGGEAGEVASRFVNSDGINKHFTDEAAPAMKRLFEK